MNISFCVGCGVKYNYIIRILSQYHDKKKPFPKAVIDAKEENDTRTDVCAGIVSLCCLTGTLIKLPHNFDKIDYF